jgi:hypothetical protein
LRVKLRIGHGLDIEDHVRVRAKTANGFAVHLKRGASIQNVLATGREVHHWFGGGLLWIDLQEGESESTVRHSIGVETAPRDPNSGFFGGRIPGVRELRYDPFYVALADDFKQVCPAGEWST